MLGTGKKLSFYDAAMLMVENSLAAGGCFSVNLVTGPSCRDVERIVPDIRTSVHIICTNIHIYIMYYTSLKKTIFTPSSIVK
jgi:hypothetical protein